MKVIISGGGTGGHIFPAIAVAQEIKRQLPDASILFVGANGRMEMDRVPKAGFDIVGLNISGLVRKLTLKNLTFPFKVMQSLYKSFSIISKFKPDIVVAFGGYASGPVSQVATWKKIPLILQEQNSFPGITNKILASKASKICVAYDGMEKYFEKNKIIFTGNPVRSDISQTPQDINSSFRYFELDHNKKTVLIFGGSLGARALNEAVKNNIDQILGKNGDVQLVWQVGKFYYDEYSKLNVDKNKAIRILPFIDRMDHAYAVADLVISRAGAISISELCLSGKACILAPSPNVAEDHQTKNAINLVEKNAAMLIKDSELDKNLGSMISDLIHDEKKLSELRNNISKLGRPNAAKTIAELVISESKC